jgi:hypothetical protein
MTLERTLRGELRVIDQLFIVYDVDGGPQELRGTHWVEATTNALLVTTHDEDATATVALEAWSGEPTQAPADAIREATTTVRFTSGVLEVGDILGDAMDGTLDLGRAQAEWNCRVLLTAVSTDPSPTESYSFQFWPAE